VSAATQVYYASFDAVFFELAPAVRLRVEARIDEIGLRLPLGFMSKRAHWPLLVATTSGPFQRVLILPRSAPAATGFAALPGETEAGVCVGLRRAAFDAMAAPAHPELWLLAHPPRAAAG
jgi:hypothetical protein